MSFRPMPLQEPELLRLALAAHESGSDPDLWPRFLESYARAIGADIALIQQHYFSERRSLALATFGMRRQFTDSYNQYYSRVNVWRNHGLRAYVQGRVVFDEEQYPRALLKRTEFYNDCLLPNRGTRCLAGVIARRDDTAVVLTALRDEPRDPFGRDQAKTIEFLLPHLTRAFVTHDRLQTLEAGEIALNSLGVGVGLLDADGRVVFCNRAAEDILRANDGLTLRNGQLTATSPDTDTALQQSIQYAIAPGEPNHRPRDVLVTRSAGRRPYCIRAAPLRRTPGPFVRVRALRALVLIADPERHRPVAVDALKQTYGLTSKEAGLALALAEGETLQQVAERLEMQYETARTHMRRILSKTGTSRQAELVGLLERISSRMLEID